ncbi:MAG: shikimate dehydrogenase [Solirubrobacterales bacterium]
MPLLAVIGFPAAHSRSPAMQNAALEERGLTEWRYVPPIEVDPAHFEAKVRELAVGDYAGANVTVPHKEAALRLADLPKREALAIGAANTLVFTAEGIEAHNTDASGLLATLPTPRLGGRRALVLGAGGAARAAVWALSQAGAVVDIWNRTSSRADAVYDELGGYVELGGAPVETPRQEIYGIIVNTTSVGLHGEDPFTELPLHRGAFAERVVVDMVYGDRPSALLEAAADEGAFTVDGIEVLVQQGARSFEIWTGQKPDLDVMRAAARA